MVAREAPSARIRGGVVRGVGCRTGGEEETGLTRKATHALPNPAVIAERIAALGRRRAVVNAERRAQQRALVEGLAGMDLEALRRHIPTKQWLLAVGVASGATLPELCGLARLKHPSSALRASRHPVVAHLVDRIKQEQLRLALNGEWGVRNAARTAAPGIMRNLIELGGAAAPDEAGMRPGRARRDADSIRAGEVVLDIAGHRVQRQEHVHYHLLEQLTEGELETLAESGQWPDRFATALAAPDALTDTGPGPGAAANDAPTPTELVPLRGGRRGRV
jgi:hypothetical protein